MAITSASTLRIFKTVDECIIQLLNNKFLFHLLEKIREKRINRSTYNALIEHMTLNQKSRR